MDISRHWIRWIFLPLLKGAGQSVGRTNEATKVFKETDGVELAATQACDWDTEKAMKEKLSGALNALGTMAVCEKLGISLAVTCGMGGIGDIKGEKLCADLPALARIPVTLVSTGPKDMLDRKETISWLIQHKVKVLGAWRDYCTGYIFSGEKVELQGVYENEYRVPA